MAVSTTKLRGKSKGKTTNFNVKLNNTIGSFEMESDYAFRQGLLTFRLDFIMKYRFVIANRYQRRLEAKKRIDGWAALALAIYAWMNDEDDRIRRKRVKYLMFDPKDDYWFWTSTDILELPNGELVEDTDDADVIIAHQTVLWREDDSDHGEKYKKVMSKYSSGGGNTNAGINMISKEKARTR